MERSIDGEMGQRRLPLDPLWYSAITKRLADPHCGWGGGAHHGGAAAAAAAAVTSYWSRTWGL